MEKLRYRIGIGIHESIIIVMVGAGGWAEIL